MKNKILIFVIAILSIIYCSIGSKTSTTFFNSEPNTINVKMKDENIKKLNLEDYVIGVVASEMPASFDTEALKAQAVAARTYALFKMDGNTKNYDVVTSVINQGYIDTEGMKKKWNNKYEEYYEKIKNAVLDTKGEVMYYNDKIIEAYYFAMSNGYTEKAGLVFSSDKDYLQSVESEYDKSQNNFIVTKRLSKNEFCNNLNINCDVINISDIKRSDTGRVNTLSINGNVFKGTEVRKKLNLRSTDFSIQENSDNLIITTKGYGHGVGMSQYGANGMAKMGKDYKEILNHYYTNVKIKTI